MIRQLFSAMRARIPFGVRVMGVVGLTAFLATHTGIAAIASAPAASR